MHDSLDLAALRTEIAAEQERQKQQKTWSKYYGWGLTGVFLLILFTPLGSFTYSLDAFPTLQLVLFFLAFGYFIPRAYTQFRLHQRYANRLNTYAPAAVPRVTPLETASVLVSWILLLLWIGLAFVLPHLFPLWIGLLALQFLISMAYRWLLGWSHKGGVARIERLLRWLPRDPFLAGYKASLLTTDNHLDEAASIYSELLARKRNRAVYAIPYWLNNLAIGLTYSGQYAEALPFHEAALNISPSLSNAYESFATWYLEQNLDAERAVDLSELALELTYPKDDNASAFERATCANALARTGRHTRADALIEQALNTTEKLENSARAEIQRQIGFARLAQGDGDAARKHFEQAVTLDPNGVYGALARKAMQ
jgi:tetratricopeptide (TPR) repeat protein